MGKYRPAVILTLALTVFLASCKGTSDDPKSWVVSTLAGQFNSPEGVAVDASGNLYVADTDNNLIRKITFTTANNVVTATISTVAGDRQKGYNDDTGARARFDSPIGVAVVGGNVYVTDAFNNRIRKIAVDNAGVVGAVTTIAGTGTAGKADTGTDADGNEVVGTFNIPQGIAVDSSGENLYVASTVSNTIRKVVISTGAVSTLAGGTWGHQDATGKAAQFRNPRGVAADSDGNLYVADFNNHCIRRIVISTGEVTTFAGNTTDTPGSDPTTNAGFADGAAATARFDSPSGVAVDSSGNVYVADKDNNRIRKITPEGVVSTIAGSTQGHHDATGTEAQFSFPVGVAVDSSGNIYVADTRNHAIRKIEYK